MIALNHLRRSCRIPIAAKTPPSENEVRIKSPPRARTGLCQPGARQSSATTAALPITNITVASFPNLKVTLS
jgi:hypothetical protein